MDSTQTENKYLIPERISAENFRTYDIRGEVSEHGLNENLAYAIGRAVGSEAIVRNRHEIIVGRDGRLSGALLKSALMTGLLDSGCDVIDIGLVPTPLVYYATFRLSTDSGVMVTGSHNPWNHNGFKSVLAGKTLAMDDIQALYQRIIQRDFLTGTGRIKTQEIISDYMNCIKERIKLARPLHVVVDCGNGAASVLASKLYRELGCKVTELFCELDGRFPNHHPDPTIPENLTTIIEEVKKQNADIGLAFDGDADRLGVVTNLGQIIWPDRLMMLFAKDLLTRMPQASIVFDVKCTSFLAKVIQENGGKPIMYRTGHSLLKNKMMEIGSPLAGEMSGHIFIKENWFGFDDGIYAGARLLEILARDQRSLSGIFAALPNSVNTPELKLPMPEARKADFMHQLLSKGDFEDAERITIDGLRVEFDFGWGLVRPSNTSSYLILRFEADNEAHLNQIKAIFRRELLKIDSTLELPF